MVEEEVNKKEINIFKELKDREIREKNVILYNYPDSKYAASSDAVNIKKLFLESDIASDIPFEVDEIRTRRIGKSFIKNKTRPLILSLNQAESVSWLFKNKSNILPEDVKISNDRTIAQRDYLKKLKSELNAREIGGESDLVIKFYQGTPQIIQKKKEN